MRAGHWILRGQTPAEADLHEWAAWFEHSDRHVAITECGPYRISTVFLGIDHNWSDGPPILFETMIFEGTESPESAFEGYTERYATWADAEVGHSAAVHMVEAATGLKADPPLAQGARLRDAAGRQ